MRSATRGAFADARLRRLYADLSVDRLRRLFMTDYQGRDELAALADRVDGWLAAIAEGNPAIASIDRGTSDDTMTGDPRRFVRMRGEERMSRRCGSRSASGHCGTRPM